MGIAGESEEVTGVEVFVLRYTKRSRGRRGGPCLDWTFPGVGGGGGEGATLRPKIYNMFFYDISLLIILSN